jgi:wyosine [tRNA(Phe)-imidazoG37] synthetase (radical SAM superfamily)
MSSKESKQRHYLYGPVPSRRLGLSLGVDIVAPKVCTLDCIYCQLGRTSRKSTTREDFVDLEAVLSELKAGIDAGLTADYITIGGSGEPTLNAKLGELIDRIRPLTDIPVAILTNGTLFDRPDVRIDCAKADVVIPSLDAGDASVFEAVCRPARDITIEKLVSGLAQFRREFPGQIWLEVFLVAGVNTGREQIEKMKILIAQMQPDKIHLNTAVRPPAEPDVQALSREAMRALAEQLGGNCEVIGEAPAGLCGRYARHAEADIVSVLERRPCSIADLCTGLRMDRAEVTECLIHLQQRGLVTTRQRGGITYFYRHAAGAQ